MNHYMNKIIVCLVMGTLCAMIHLARTEEPASTQVRGFDLRGFITEIRPDLILLKKRAIAMDSFWGVSFHFALHGDELKDVSIRLGIYTDANQARSRYEWAVFRPTPPWEPYDATADVDLGDQRDTRNTIYFRRANCLVGMNGTLPRDEVMALARSLDKALQQAGPWIDRGKDPVKPMALEVPNSAKVDIPVFIPLPFFTNQIARTDIAITSNQTSTGIGIDDEMVGSFSAQLKRNAVFSLAPEGRYFIVYFTPLEACTDNFQIVIANPDHTMTIQTITLKVTE